MAPGLSTPASSAPGSMCPPPGRCIVCWCGLVWSSRSRPSDRGPRSNGSSTRPPSLLAAGRDRVALADQSEACILRLTDDHARMILASRAAPAETTLEAWALVETALARHGRPVMVLSDGGSAFTSRRTTGGISVFEQRLREQGINPVVSSPRHPQTCGKKERDWQPLKRWLAAHPPAATLAELQSLLDAYDVLFNTDRPHQGINGSPRPSATQPAPSGPSTGTVATTGQPHRATGPSQRSRRPRQPILGLSRPRMDRSHGHRGPRRPRCRDPPRRTTHQAAHNRHQPEKPGQRTQARPPTQSASVRPVMTHVSDTSRHMTRFAKHGK